MTTCVGLFLLLLAWATLELWSQTATGRVTGTVLDSSGLGVPGASVSVKGETTGISFSATTNTPGSFNVADLLPGEYSVEVNASGFRRQVIRRLKVDVAKENRSEEHTSELQSHHDLVCRLL